MKKILLIGAGEIGSRHAQGIAKYGLGKVAVDIVDSDPRAETRIINRMREACDEIMPSQIHFYDALQRLPRDSSYDLVILATSSLPRHQIFKDCTELVTASHYLLEKVVFNSVAQYQSALEIIREKGLSCWVNTSKRFMPAFLHLKEVIQSLPVKAVRCKVDSGLLGIGCNSIHFLDLLHFWTGAAIKEILIAPDKVQDSKRPGYKEICGALTATYSDGSALEFISKDTAYPWTMTLRAQNFAATISNGGKLMTANHSSGNQTTLKFSAPYQSDITKNILGDLFQGRPLNLAKLDEIERIDRLFLTECTRKIAQTLGTELDLCPIT